MLEESNNTYCHLTVYMCGRGLIILTVIDRFICVDRVS